MRRCSGKCNETSSRMPLDGQVPSCNWNRSVLFVVRSTNLKDSFECEALAERKNRCWSFRPARVFPARDPFVVKSRVKALTVVSSSCIYVFASVFVRICYTIMVSPHRIVCSGSQRILSSPSPRIFNVPLYVGRRILRPVWGRPRGGHPLDLILIKWAWFSTLWPTC